MTDRTITRDRYELTFGCGWHTADRLAHYGPPETLVGRWALELAEETP